MFDQKKPLRTKRHSVSDIRGCCTQCGLDLVSCQFQTLCTPDSEEAQVFRKKSRDSAVGRVVQRG